MPFPFEVGFDEVQSNLDEYVDAVFGCLESEFLVMPKGTGFVEFSTFETGYEALKRATGGFRDVSPEKVAPVVFEVPISLVASVACWVSRRRSGPTTRAGTPAWRSPKARHESSTGRSA